MLDVMKIQLRYLRPAANGGRCKCKQRQVDWPVWGGWVSAGSRLRMAASPDAEVLPLGASSLANTGSSGFLWPCDPASALLTFFSFLCKPRVEKHVDL